MPDYPAMERQLSEGLQLEHRPVAIAFREEPPPGVPRFIGAEPSGCSFWRLAGAGRTFYTVPSDHYNCPVGSYTHQIALPPERAHELEQVVGFMTSIGYIRMEEVPGIPRLPSTPGAIIYSPLAETPVDPDVVLFWGRPGSMMLLQEAALRGGVAPQMTTLARPTCMALPAALGGGMVASTGCIGNRVYTGIDESEFYVAVAGRDLGRVVEQVETIRTANAALLKYHQDRRRVLATE
jgi:uncharacterized protein (DUF169 family)